MTPTPPTGPAGHEARSDRLALLMAYTTFHVGAYLALAGGGLFALSGAETPWLVLPICLFLVAGIAGSVVGSNITRFDSYDLFMTTPIGIGGRTHFVPRVWIALEHNAFWCGLVSGLAIVAATR